MNNSIKARSIYNILSGIVGQIITIALGIVIPRMFLVNFGSEVNGLLSSVTQIYTYLALLEAGVGTASLQALYKPVCLRENNRVSEIMSATHFFYKKTGRIYLLSVLLMSCIYPLIVNSKINYWTIVTIFLINCIPGVVNFYFQGKYKILLQAEGKQYIITNLTTITTILVNVSKIILMLLGADVVIVQTGYLFFNLLQMLFIMIYMKKNYKWLNVNADPDFKAIEQKNSVLVQQICDLVFRNTDVLILTLFCNLKLVSIYSIYTMLFSMISTFLDNFSQGFSFALGQLFNVNRQRYIELRDIYETYRITLVFALFTVASLFVLPFLKLYTSGVNDINYLDPILLYLFVFMYLLSCGRANAAADINYAQHFKQTQSRAILEAVINLSVSIIGVQFIGIYGVLLGTIVALFYRANDMIIYANRRILKRSPWRTYKCWFSNMIIFSVIHILAGHLTINLDSYVYIIGWAAASAIIIFLVYFTIISILFPKERKGAYIYIRSLYMGRKGLK